MLLSCIMQHFWIRINHQELSAALIWIILLLMRHFVQYFRSISLNLMPLLTGSFSMCCGNNGRISGALWPISAVTDPMPTKAVQLSKKHWQNTPSPTIQGHADCLNDGLGGVFFWVFLQLDTCCLWAVGVNWWPQTHRLMCVHRYRKCTQA